MHPCQIAENENEKEKQDGQREREKERETKNMCATRRIEGAYVKTCLSLSLFLSPSSFFLFLLFLGEANMFSDHRGVHDTTARPL